MEVDWRIKMEIGDLIEFDEEFRSPGWDRYKKNKLLKWKK